MSLFTKMRIHCATCGTDIWRVMNKPNEAYFCDDECREKYELLYVKSVMGKEFLEKP